MFEDADGDGQQGANEDPIQGVTVNLLDAAGNQLATTTTDATGNYIFDDLPAGDYIVEFVDPEGRLFTAPNSGDDALDSDAGPNGQTAVINLGPGEDDETVDAGLVPPAAIALAKDLTDGPIDNNDGSYTIEYSFIIENIGEVDLTDVGIADDFQDVFGAAATVTGPTPVSGTCDALAAFNGTASLAVGESCTAVWSIVVSGVTPGVTYNNTATATGTPPFGPDVTDVSDDGVDADPNDNGDAGEPGEDDPTPAIIPDPLKATLGDKVFEDTNGDGVQDGGEPGVENVTVELLDANGDVLETTTTDENGLYSFSDLDAGTYSVRFTAPDGTVLTSQDAPGDDSLDSDADPATGVTAPITLNPGDVNDTIDAGVVPLASLGNKVFDDTNGDGVQDAGEPGVEGVTVELLDGDGNVVATQMTDAAGEYLFEDLVPGSYTVRFTAPEGRELTAANVGDDAADSDPDPATGLTAPIVLGPGDNNTTVDAGLAPLVPAISLAKSLTDGPTDNGDGSYTIEYSFVIENIGEVDLTNVGITDNFQAVFGAAATVTGPTPVSGTCDAAAAFTGTASLAVGESCTAVWSIVVSGVTPGVTYNNTATATGTPPVGDPVTDVSDDATVTDATPSESDPTPATIPAPPEKALLGNKVFLDTDGDGIQDAGEDPVAGVVVKVTKADGSDPILTETDENGMWSVEVDPGDYIVEFTNPDDDAFVFSPQDAGSDDVVDSDAGPNGVTGTISVTAGETNDRIDAGLIELGTLGNRVFLDANSNGLQDAGEAAVPGATVQLFAANADGTKGAQAKPSQLTDANGNYLFEGLLPGDYIVVVTPPAGFVVGPQNAGADDDIDNDVSPTTGETGVISVAGGQDVDNVDAGVVPAPVVNPRPRPIPSSPALPIPVITNSPVPTPAPAAPVTPPLALTGSSSNVLATLAIAMMGVGATMLVGARRERDKE